MARLRFRSGGSGGRQRSTTGGRPSTLDAMAYPDPCSFRELGESRTDGSDAVLDATLDATLATAELELLDRADLLGATGPSSRRAFALASVRFDLPAFADEGVDAAPSPSPGLR